MRLVVLPLGVLFLAGCGASSGSPENQVEPPVVRTIVAERGSASVERVYAASVVARREVRRGFQVGGKIAERNVEVGDLVSAGDVLAVIDESDLDLAVSAAEADLRAAEASLRVAAAEEARLRDLVQPGAISQSVYDRQAAALSNAEERVTQLQARLDLARNSKNYTRLLAAADGVVTHVLAEAGQVVSAGQPIIAIALTSELEAEVFIPESRLNTAANASAELSLWTDAAVRHPLTLRELAPQADPVTRTYQARFTLPGDIEARLGMTGTVHFQLEGDGALKVPQSAVFSIDGTPSVWVVSAENRIDRREVAVARYTGSDVIISTGLDGGEQVVAFGAHLLQVGDEVRTDGAEPGPDRIEIARRVRR